MRDEAKDRIEKDVSFDEPRDDIRCRDCAWKLSDYAIDGKVLTEGYKKRFCNAYPSEDDSKPLEILWDGADCEYHATDNEAN